MKTHDLGFLVVCPGCDTEIIWQGKFVDMPQCECGEPRNQEFLERCDWLHEQLQARDSEIFVTNPFSRN